MSWSKAGAVLLFAVLGACGGGNYAPVEDGSIGGARAAEGVVVAGDTLYAIAWRYGADYRDVARWNGLRPPYIVRPGQRLRLAPPASARNPAPLSRPASTARRTTTSSAAAPDERPDLTAAGPSTAPAASTRPAAGREPSGSQPPSQPPQRAASPSGPTWQWPLRGRIVRGFGADKPGAAGIDIAASDGATVRAAADGRVVYRGSGLPGYGRLIIVKHTESLLSAYGYLGETHVNEGEAVRRGQVIADVGTGGGYRSPVLHFEIRRDGNTIDPLSYLPG